VRRAPALLVSVLAVSLALCATSQVFCSRMNQAVMPSIWLSLDEAFESLSARHNNESTEYVPRYSNATTHNLHQYKQAPIPTEADEKSYTLTHSFLNYFFDELDHVIQTTVMIKNTARFIQVPSSVVAS